MPPHSRIVTPWVLANRSRNRGQLMHQFRAQFGQNGLPIPDTLSRSLTLLVDQIRDTFLNPYNWNARGRIFVEFLLLVNELEKHNPGAINLLNATYKLDAEQTVNLEDFVRVLVHQFAGLDIPAAVMTPLSPNHSSQNYVVHFADALIRDLTPDPLPGKTPPVSPIATAGPPVPEGGPQEDQQVLEAQDDEVLHEFDVAPAAGNDTDGIIIRYDSNASLEMVPGGDMLGMENNEPTEEEQEAAPEGDDFT